MKFTRALPPLIFCALCVAAWGVGPERPPVPKRPHKSAQVERGAGAAKLIAKIVIPPAPTTNTFVWRYPPGLNPSNLWWSVEASSDLGNWITVISNATGPGEIRVKRGDPPGFYRLSARAAP